MNKSWITWPFQWLSYFVFSDEWAPDVSQISPMPFLIIHGEKDQIVPNELSDLIYAQAKEPKELWKIPDANHIQTFFINHQSYRKKLFNYLNQLP